MIKKTILIMTLALALFLVGCAGGVDVEELSDDQLDYVVAADEPVAQANIAGEAFKAYSRSHQAASNTVSAQGEKANKKVPHTGAPIRIKSIYYECIENEDSVTQTYQRRDGFLVSRTLDKFICTGDALYERYCSGSRYRLAVSDTCSEGCSEDRRSCAESVEPTHSELCSEEAVNAGIYYDAAYDNDEDCYMHNPGFLPEDYTADCDDFDASVNEVCEVPRDCSEESHNQMGSRYNTTLDVDLDCYMWGPGILPANYTQDCDDRNASLTLTC